MEKVIKYRWLIIIISAIVTITLAFSLLKIKINSNLKSYFPRHMESLIATDSIESIFGSQDMIIILFETDDIINKESLARVKKIDRALSRLPEIRKTTSLFTAKNIYGEEGVMYVDPVISRIPDSKEEYDKLKKELLGNDMALNIVVAEDFQSTAIITNLSNNANEDSLFVAIDQILADNPGDEKVYFGGVPFIRHSINTDIKRDGLILIPSALVLMIIFLAFVFREWRGVILPFLVVVMAAVLSLSLLPIIGWDFYFITILVPIMLIAVANDYGIHLMARYQELNARGSGISISKIAAGIADNLKQPIILTGITTIAGVAALFTHKMIPAREMALIASIGIAVAVIYSILFLPAMLSVLGPSKPVLKSVREYKNGQLKILRKLAVIVVRYYRQIPIIAFASTLILAAGILLLHVDSNEENFFPGKHPVKQASVLINEHYGGSESLSVLFHGDMLDPDILSRMEYYEERMKTSDNVDQVMSLPDVIKEISKALNDESSEFYNVIPPSREAVAQYLELYNMNGSSEDLDQLLDFTYQYGHMMIRLKSTSNKDIDETLAFLRTLTEGDPAVSVVGGYGYVRSQLADMVVRGQFYSLLIALLVIFLILAFIFKSGKSGFLGILPLSIAVLALFGIMGYAGINLDIATAMLSSVMIGVGVDYTIHFMWRYREEKEYGKSDREAVIITLLSTGRGILFNALSVIVGFVILLFSSFTPIRFFGLLIVISIAACLIGALVLLPALILKYHISMSDSKEIKNEARMLDSYKKVI